MAALGGAGCGREKPASRAHLEVINASDRGWRIAITAAADREPRHWTVAPRQTIEAEVPAGVYAIEQALLMADGGVAETRHLSAELEAGHSYRWRLTTLLSESR